MEPILTVPEAFSETRPPWATGNEWVSLPEIDPARAAVGAVSVLWEGLPGLATFRGRGGPLLSPCVRVDGEEWELAWDGSREGGWLPALGSRRGAVAFRLRIFAPPGFRGFAVALSARAAGDARAGAARADAPAARRRLELGFRVAAPVLDLSLFTPRRPHVPWRVALDRFAGAVRWEPLAAGLPAFAARVAGSGALAAAEVRIDPAPGPDPEAPPGGGRLWPIPAPVPPDAAAGGARAAPAPSAPRASSAGGAGAPGVRLAVALEAWDGRAAQVFLFFGVGREGDGAALAAVDLARRGARALLARARAEAAEVGVRIRGEARPRPVPARAAARIAANLMFNLHFARGRTLDRERPALVTSRSSRYYVAAAHWTRDALLWSLPGLLAADPRVAREALLTAFERYTRHPGEHAQYLDGGLLYAGFELDELAAFPVALARYLEATGDASLAAEPAVRAAWPRIRARLSAFWDERAGLARTELLPTDDPAPLPFHAYGNALLSVGLRAAARFGWPLADDPGAMAERIRAEFPRRFVREGPFGPQFAGLAGEGGDARLATARFWDDPPGSLELLAHYGFCDPDDPVFLRTCGWIRSRHNPHALASAPGSTTFEPSSPHAPYRWTLAWANALWAGAAAARHARERGSGPWTREVFARAEAALRAFVESPMDAGIACETVGGAGEVRTGPAFASCAGFLAAAALAWLRERPAAAA